jgi:anti-sigma B factor antagonist
MRTVGDEAPRELTSGALTVRSGRDADGYVVGLSGELDLAAVDLVAQEMERARASDATSIVLDLSKLEFIDSTGIQLLLKLDLDSRANGDRLRVTRSSRPVERVLRLTGVDARLPYAE